MLMAAPFAIGTTANALTLPAHTLTGNEPVDYAPEKRLASQKQEADRRAPLNQMTLTRDDEGWVTWVTPTGRVATLNPASAREGAWLVYRNDGEDLMGFYWKSGAPSILALSIDEANSRSVTLAEHTVSTGRILYFGVAGASSIEHPLEKPAVLLQAIGVPNSEPAIKPNERVDVITTAAQKQPPFRVKKFPVLGEQRLQKLIHSRNGFCFLSLVDGDFRGTSEMVRVFKRSKDKFWYLEVREGGGGIHGQATCIVVKK
jgi:hypothetical protein